MLKYAKFFSPRIPHNNTPPCFSSPGVPSRCSDRKEQTVNRLGQKKSRQSPFYWKPTGQFHQASQSNATRYPDA